MYWALLQGDQAPWPHGSSPREMEGPKSEAKVFLPLQFLEGHHMGPHVHPNPLALWYSPTIWTIAGYLDGITLGESWQSHIKGNYPQWRSGRTGKNQGATHRIWSLYSIAKKCEWVANVSKLKKIYIKIFSHLFAKLENLTSAAEAEKPMAPFRSEHGYPDFHNLQHLLLFSDIEARYQLPYSNSFHFVGMV